jgi:CheY-like chemotaxis protein
MAVVPRPGRVIVIEDEPRIRELVSAVVGIVNMDSSAYENGQDAVDGISEHFQELDGVAPDIAVILSDIQMPVLDGPSAVEEIIGLYGQHYNGSYLPEIKFMSGQYTPEQGKQVSTLTDHPILEKPVNVSDIKKNLTEAQEAFYQRVNSD